MVKLSLDNGVHVGHYASRYRVNHLRRDNLPNDRAHDFILQTGNRTVDVVLDAGDYLVRNHRVDLRDSCVDGVDLFLRPSLVLPFGVLDLNKQLIYHLHHLGHFILNLLLRLVSGVHLLLHLCQNRQIDRLRGVRMPVSNKLSSLSDVLVISDQALFVFKSTVGLWMRRKLLVLGLLLLQGPRTRRSLVGL